MSRASAGHYLIGIEGLALLRSWLDDRQRSDRRVSEIQGFLATSGAGPLAIELDVPANDVRTGYARWAGTYDAAPNPLIKLEEPIVRAMIDAQPAGVALDAACGTGRHAKYLRARGHEVIGVDGSAEMLARARRDLPDADLREGDLLDLPLATASVDLVVCALALTHFSSLAAPIRSLARVLRPGGRMILSDLHPTLTAIGSTAFFVTEDGGAGSVRSYFHPHSAYLAAFRSSDLAIEQCVEPLNGEEEAAMMSGGMIGLAPEAFRSALVGLPQALIWQLLRT
jgi:SAM-dependent methyltransferase